MKRPLVRAITLAALAAASVSSARAQAAPATTAREPYRQAFTLNPLGIPFGWVNGEFERVLGGGATLGIGGSWLEVDDDDDFASVEAKLRYYPSERGLRGFSIGLSAGYTRIEDNQETIFGPDRTPRAQVVDGPSLGVMADYNWLIGARRRFVVGAGLGAKRIFTDDRSNDSDLIDLDDIRAYPTMRLVVGVAF